MKNNLYGTILKGIGGFYYVESADSKIYECKVRGVFRKENLIPYVGDKVLFCLNKDGFPSIEQILPRKNYLMRPPISNINNIFIVTSINDPKPNPLIIDKMLAMAYYKNIEPVLIISKSDLMDSKTLFKTYNSIGIKTLLFSKFTGEGLCQIKNLLKNKISVFTGNSGVGKSTLLNCLYSELDLLTGTTSKKLGRGKHTTRQVELFKINNKSYVADTPGFSSMDFRSYEDIKKEELANCFLDFKPYLNKCKFASCTHICENGCAILSAVNSGNISELRHKSYTSIYNELNEIKKWK